MTPVDEVRGRPSDYDLDDLAMRLREADKREVYEVTGLSAAAVLRASAHVSDKIVGFWVDGTLIAVAGLRVLPLLRCGIPWFLGSDEVDQRPVEMLRVSRRLLREWSGCVDRFDNVVAVSHKSSVRYLRALGFSFGEPFTGPAGFPVMRFSLERANVR